MATAYVAATIPARTVRTSFTTLFRIAMEQQGDPLQWAAIAQLNGMIDPWITGQEDIEIPPVFSTFASGAETGLLLVMPGGATAVQPGPSSAYKWQLYNLGDFRNLLGL